MSVYQVCKVLHDVYTKREVAMAARAGDFSILDCYALTAEERAAIEKKDLVTLYRLGAHPVLIFHFSAVLNPRESYVKEVVPQIQNAANPFYDYYKNRADYGKRS